MQSIGVTPMGARWAKRRVVRPLFASAAVLLMAIAPSGAYGTTVPKNAVGVIFDSSLTDPMAAIATAFHKATGLSMLQTSGATAVDARAIAGKTAVEDIFVSEGAAAQQFLEAKKHGSWVGWYAQFGSTPLVLAYNPKSKFANDLRTMPWYEVVTMKGFELGRATPETDSSGSLAIAALEDAAKAEHLLALSRLVESKAGVYSESDLMTQLQQGHLAAAFVYKVDADANSLRSVPLGSLHLSAPYMITILRNSAHEGAAVSFVKFLLRAGTAGILVTSGVSAKNPPILSGPIAAVPSPLRSLFPATKH